MVEISRSIGIPSSISSAAQRQLETMMAMTMEAGDPPSDAAGWRAIARFADEMLLAMLPPVAPGSESVATALGGTPTFEVAPEGAGDALTCLFVHGGAFTMGAGPVCEAMTAAFAVGIGVRTFGVDYRMPPDHPFPTPLEDCVAAYRALLEMRDPQSIVVTGVSAGGSLASALVLRAMEEGLPMPAAVVLLSPECDLTESGDSFETVLGVDPVLRSRLTDSIALYADGHDLRDPMLSPLFADYSKGFPPTFLQCGTRDLFLSNTVRLHRALRRADVPADLHVFEAMPHGGFGSMLEGGLGTSPEDQEVYEELRRFLDGVAG